MKENPDKFIRREGKNHKPTVINPDKGSEIQKEQIETGNSFAILETQENEDNVTEESIVKQPNP